jgi:uncharacterized membrane protein
MYRENTQVYRPFSKLYFIFFLVGIFIVIQFILNSFRNVLISGLGIPPEYVGIYMFISLFGSWINIPLTTLQTRIQVKSMREVSAFGVSWRHPVLEQMDQMTNISINLGGAIVPILTSIYLLIVSIPSSTANLFESYAVALSILLVVTLTVNRVSRVIPGLGVASPVFVAPAVTACMTILIDYIIPLSCPTQVAYVGGTLGALIGADLLNFKKLKEIGEPYVSIGGAGTFDGVYLTGLISVLMVWLLL